MIARLRARAALRLSSLLSHMTVYGPLPVLAVRCQVALQARSRGAAAERLVTQAFVGDYEPIRSEAR